MTEQTQWASGTVAEEAVRLIEAMASMARSGATAGQGASTDAGGPAEESAPGAEDAAPRPDNRDESSQGACSACGGEHGGTPVACKLCPVCQGIAFIRSVRPETVDRLADLASAVASSLRDMATQSRASGPGSAAGTPSEDPPRASRSSVQDIHVDDEDEG